MNIHTVFDENGNSKLHNHPDYRVICTKPNAEGDIILVYCNTYFLKSFSLTEKDFGSLVSDILDTKTANIFYERYYLLKNKEVTSSFFHSLTICRDSDSISDLDRWLYYVFFEGDMLISIGQPHRANSLSTQVTEHDLNSFIHSTGSDYLYFTLNKECNEYYFKDDDPNLLTLFGKDTLVGETIKTIHKVRSDDVTNSILDACLNSKKIIEYVDIKPTSKKMFYFKITLIPSKTSPTEILVLAIAISGKEYHKLRYTNETIHTYLSSKSNYGSCQINLEIHPHIEIANRYFYDFLYKYSVTLDDILNYSEYKIALDKKITTTKKYILPDQQQNNSEFSFAFIPMINDKTVVKILVIISISEEKTFFDELLTKREIEIVNLIADNKSNKHIALELNITEGTVKRTVYNIYRKLNVSSRVELVKLILKF